MKKLRLKKEKQKKFQDNKTHESIAFSNKWKESTQNLKREHFYVERNKVNRT